MILPPMVAYSKGLSSTKDALIDYMGVDCIQSCNVDEQCVFLTFKETEATPVLEKMIDDLTYGILFFYNGVQYKLHTQYFDI